MQFFTDLFTFTKEIFNGKLHCAVYIYPNFQQKKTC